MLPREGLLLDIESLLNVTKELLIFGRFLFEHPLQIIRCCCRSCLDD